MSLNIKMIQYWINLVERETGACEFAKFADWKLLITRLKDTREQQFPDHRLSLGWMFHFIIFLSTVSILFLGFGSKLIQFF